MHKEAALLCIFIVRGEAVESVLVGKSAKRCCEVFVFPLLTEFNPAWLPKRGYAMRSG